MKSNNEIHPSELWGAGNTEGLKDFILAHARAQTNERKLQNELLAIRYKIEDYITSANNGTQIKVLDFVKMYLEAFGITQKKLADLFEMKGGNLHKYLNGERKLNTSLVLKLSSFSHTSPEYWLRVQVKNELIEINKEKERIGNYEKYDYKNLIVPSNL